MSENALANEGSSKEDLLMLFEMGYGFELRHASVELRGDRELALFAMKSAPQVFPYLTKKLRADMDLAYMAVRHNQSLFMNISRDLTDNIDFAKTLASTLPRPLSFVEHLPTDFFEDEELMLQVVKIDGEKVMLALGKARTSRKIAETAVRQSSGAYRGLHPQFLDDLELALLALRGFGSNESDVVPYMQGELVKSYEMTCGKFNGSENRHAIEVLEEIKFCQEVKVGMGRIEKILGQPVQSGNTRKI